MGGKVQMNQTGTQPIETRRLLLRPFQITDAEDMFSNWASDTEVTRFLTWPPHAGVEVTKALLQDWTMRYDAGNYFNWAIEWKESGQVIGNISVVRLDEIRETAEMGYCLSRRFWGREIMPEALRSVMAYLFDAVGLRRIAACHDANNPKSGRVMQKAGMRYEGCFRGAGRNNRGICDEVWYAALKDDRRLSNNTVRVPISVRFADEKDLDRVNELRRQVNALHVAGKPDVFKPGFCDELRNYIHVIFHDPEQKIVAAVADEKLYGFAVLHHINKPENPYMYERDFLDIDEFCVDQACRRQGIASAMIRFIKDYAKEQGYHRIELNMWEFNRDALTFYEAAGFTTFRRYMEMKL